MRTLPNLTIVLALLFTTASAWAGESKSIQGTVLGTDGKPLAGADVRADRLDAKATPALTKTDAKGQYVFKVLPVGAYDIKVFVKNVPKSHAAVRTRADGWAKVDFDLRTTLDSPNVKRRYVWVPGEPGSHIGGRWVPVDQAMPTTSAVDTVGSDDVNRMQRDTRLNANAMGSGR